MAYPYVIERLRNLSENIQQINDSDLPQITNELTALNKRIDDVISNIGAKSTNSSYLIELDRWGIYNDDTHYKENCKGLDDAITWAHDQGFTEVVVPDGTYTFDLKWLWDNKPGPSFNIPNGMTLTLLDGATLKIRPNGSDAYGVIILREKHDITIRGGKVRGDRDEHKWNVPVYFEIGGIDPATGVFINDPSKIRSITPLKRSEMRDILSGFRIWKPTGCPISTMKYSFFQYEDNGTLNLYKNDGDFTPGSSGRGWLSPLRNTDNGYMHIVVDMTANLPMKPEWFQEDAPNRLYVNIQRAHDTQESGLGILMENCTDIRIENMDIGYCTGDSITTGQIYRVTPSDYKPYECGTNILIKGCELHHSRRQGISICGSNETYVIDNVIHDIGGATFETGIAPMYGIDLEAQPEQLNRLRAPDPNDPTKPWTRMNENAVIKGNVFYSNRRGDITNPDCNYLFVFNNHFKSNSMSTFGSFGSYVITHDNIFDVGCVLWTEGKSDGHIITNNLFCDSSLINLSGSSKNTLISGCNFLNGAYIAGWLSSYYLGNPTVNITTSTFTLNNHGMGNTAACQFTFYDPKELPGGVDGGTYYVVNSTSNTFQLSKTKNGSPITVTSTGGKYGISRVGTNNTVISNCNFIADNPIQGAAIALQGTGTVKNIYCENYGSLTSPTNNLTYFGGPIVYENIYAINAYYPSYSNGTFINCHFEKGRGAKRLGDNMALNDSTVYNNAQFINCYFNNGFSNGLNLEFAILVKNAKFVGCRFENMILRFYNSAINEIFNSCMFNNVVLSTKSNTSPIVYINNSIYKNVTYSIEPNTIFEQNNVII